MPRLYKKSLKELARLSSEDKSRLPAPSDIGRNNMLFDFEMARDVS